MSAIHPHRPGPFKQRNKVHKSGRHKSKGEKAALDKGRVSAKVHSVHQRIEARRVNKKNKIRQLRAQKRDQTLSSKRCVGTEGQPPHLVVLVPLTDVSEVFQMLTCCDSNRITTISCPKIRQRFTIIAPSTGNLYKLLDLIKVADTAVLVHSMVAPSLEKNFLDAICAQGLPTTLHVAIGSDVLNGKALSSARKVLVKKIQSRFPGEKLHLLNQMSRLQLLQIISAQKRRCVFSRDHHPHMLVENSEFVPSDNNYGTLKLTGYVRGRSLDVNSVLYIPEIGDFLMSQIDGVLDPCIKTQVQMEPSVLLMADPKQQCIVREVATDPMDQEQTWPTDFELATAREKRCLPNGMSDYQASWFADSDFSEDCSSDEWVESHKTDQLEESMSIDNTESTTDEDNGMYDRGVDVQTEQKEFEKLRAAKDMVMYPDEVDTPQDVPARQRFQKYRGLRSFRNSSWDKLENLPPDYSRIFQFVNFRASRQSILDKLDDHDGAFPGWYVTLHIKDFPKDKLQCCDPLQFPLVVYGLLPHEHKMTLLHLTLRKNPEYCYAIKSKEQLVFHCGVRRFSACPIFSQHTPGDKQKFERFLPDNGVCVATLFAPVTYPPQPVLVFKQDDNGEAVLVGSGGVLGVNPERVIVKRILLSGHPFKINKRSAVIRYMFFNRQDIEWFKPVELHTRLGRKGHIKEPLGTHGHMKCVFDGHLKAQDTVLMNLYKRVYPKWSYKELADIPTHWSFTKQLILLWKTNIGDTPEPKLYKQTAMVLKHIL